MYCKYCGKEVPEGTDICPECGKILNDKKLPKLNEMISQTTQLHTFFEELYKIQKIALILSISTLICLLLSIAGNSYGVLVFLLLVVVLISFVLSIKRLILIIENRKLNKYINYELILEIIGVVLVILAKVVSSTYLQNMMTSFERGFSILSFVFICYAVQDYALERDYDELYMSANNTSLILTIFTVIAFVLSFISVDTSIIQIIESTIVFIASLIYFKLIKDAKESLYNHNK